MIRRPAALLLGVLLCAGSAGAAGMPLERDRLVNLESPSTVGFLKFRFDFQHNFKDYTLLPVADLTLIVGVWHGVQLEAEALLHNQESFVFGHKSTFQYNVTEWGIKWAPLDQSQEDWCSLAIGAAQGRSDIKYKLFAPELATPSQLRYHFLHRSLYAIATWDSPWLTPYAGIRWVEFADSRGGGRVMNTGGSGLNYWREEEDRVTGARIRRIHGVVAPGLGLRIKAVRSRDAQVHLIGDFQFETFDSKYSANAWGAGAQFLWKTPHIYSFYISNTHGDTAPESVFGSRSGDPAHQRQQEMFYTFRWSYRF